MEAEAQRRQVKRLLRPSELEDDESKPKLRRSTRFAENRDEMNKPKKSRRRRSKSFVEPSTSAPRIRLKDACSMAWMWT
eukprot:6229513-Heterocapsa_arctica.AAC.1